MASALPLHRIGADPNPGETLPPPSPIGSDQERERILSVLAECGGNQSRAAKQLGISRTTLVARLDGYGVPRPRKP
jgi:DNA-binding NtrC family response regulator